MKANVYWTVVLWALWCFFHSFLITDLFSEWFKERTEKGAAWYRLSYVVFSIITIMPLLAFMTVADQTVLLEWNGPWRIIQVLLIGYALFFFVGGTREYDMKTFLGIRQIKALWGKERETSLRFATNGVHRLIRHPWYSGAIAFLWCFGPFTDINVAARIVLTIYLIIGTLLEERKLVAAIGSDYKKYQKEVPMLFPWKFGKR